MSYRILIADDEKDIVDLLKFNFERQNEFEVFTALDGRDALRTAMKIKPHLILLDILMPIVNGFEVCKTLKSDLEFKNTPIIFLTAMTDEDSEISGLEIGADDYIQKPFTIKKVIARVKMIIRRYFESNKNFINTSDYIRFNDLEIELSSDTVRIDGEEVYFPQKELLLLEYLLRNQNKNLSISLLRSRIYEDNPYISPKTIELHINRIKEKLGDYSIFIEKVEGDGYKFKSL
jgi:two-component system alkaline phosphatase synthesis response regulator PhoP